MQKPGGLMVSALNSGQSGLYPGQGNCVLVLGKTLNSRSKCLYPPRSTCIL